MSITDSTYWLVPLPEPKNPLYTTIDEQERAIWLEKGKRLAELLQSWIDDEESAEEQKETLECLMKALDEDHLSDRKLFPGGDE